MGCRSDYMEDSAQEKNDRLALAELSELHAVCGVIIGILSARFSYPPSLNYKSLLDAMTKFCCDSIPVLDGSGIRPGFDDPVIRKWRNKHMDADLKRAKGLQDEADADLKRAKRLQDEADEILRKYYITTAGDDRK